MKIHKVEQGTEEWFDVRRGKMTASNAQAISACGKGLETYIFKMMSEKFATGEQDPRFSNSHTDRGHELEELAREAYEMKNNCEVEVVGFVEYDEFTGFSPDGLVAEDGGVEIKCLTNEKYFKHLYYGEKMVESSHVWQVQMQLLLSGRKWWDLCYYNPNYPQSMCVYRITPDPVKTEKLKKGFSAGIALIKAINMKMNHAKPKAKA